MFQQTRFNIRYAYQNLMRGGLWTVFAIFCIAAGVSAVVAMRGLGLAIEDTLLSTVRESNNGDLLLSRGGNSPFSAISGIEGVGGDNGGNPELSYFSADTVADVQAYVDENGGTMSVYQAASGLQVTALGENTNGRPQFMSVLFVDPPTYTPIGEVRTIDPPDTPISQLLIAGETTIVVSENFADQRDLSVGDSVQVSGSDTPYTIVGIAATEEEAGLQDLIASFFGFAYLHQAQAEALNVRPDPNRIAIALAPGTDIIQAAREVNRLTPRRTSVRNVISIEENLGEVTDVMGRMIVVAGLGALVIGGVGIINTMLVMVRRRTMEIAALKTFGLKGGQIANLFMWEAFLLGIMGSVVGVLIGTLMGSIVNSFGEAFLQQSLAWRFYPEAALYGMVLGVSITSVFGVMPVLTATKVRPAAVMRPNETHVPVVGILQSIGVLLLVVLSIGAMAGAILASGFPVPWIGFAVGFGGTAGALVIVGLLIVIMWLIVWLMSRLPAFGIIDLRLALRNMTNRRWRTATTLVALMAGMYALSSITFVSQTARNIVNFQLSNTLGGNVLIFPLTTIFLSPDVADPVINLTLDQIEGVESRTRSDFYGLEVLTLDGEIIEYTVPFVNDDDGEPMTFTGTMLGTVARRSNNPNLNSGVITEGRDLTPDDVGQPVIVLNENALGEGSVPFSVGQVLTVEVGREIYDLTVVGKISSGTPTAQAFIPMDVITSRPEVSITTVQVAEEYLDSALLSLTALPTMFVLDISFVDGLIQRLIDQFSAIPTVIGLLALLAAGAIMANTVLLATLERRKQMGVLKAVGLKGRRVLGVLLIENTIIALLGAGLGIGLSAMNSLFMSGFGIGNFVAVPPNAWPTVIALVVAALVIAWLSTWASANVITRESVSTVLRYD